LAVETSGIAERIDEHFFECLRIKLSSLVLSKISNHAALVAGEGKLKVTFIRLTFINIEYTFICEFLI
jgi:hypothetical protein